MHRLGGFFLNIPIRIGQGVLAKKHACSEIVALEVCERLLEGFVVRRHADNSVARLLRTGGSKRFRSNLWVTWPQPKRGQRRAQLRRARGEGRGKSPPSYRHGDPPSQRRS